MRNDAPTNVKYILYVHYSNNDGNQPGKDPIEYQKKPSISTLRGLRGLIDLRENIRLMGEMLSSAPFEGMVQLFYAPGLVSCLDEISLGRLPQNHDEAVDLLKTKVPALNYAETFRKEFVREVAKEFTGPESHIRSRIRLITALDIFEIFGKFHGDIAQNLKYWLIGHGQSIQYDSPKIIEAIVRLRLLGMGVPVFRLDWDVFLPASTTSSTEKVAHWNNLGYQVSRCLRAYWMRRDEPHVATFIFSASYNTRPVENAETQDAFDSWVGAFATRAFPTLLVDRDRLRKDINDVSAGSVSQGETWVSYGRDMFLREIAEKFYGFKRGSIRCSEVAGLSAIGANPEVSVISGAMLCLSPGAILDLPPFSNFRMNVSWIDDHLKFCLHRELRHLTHFELRGENVQLNRAKIDSVRLDKARQPLEDLPKYVLNGYLPTLLWGTVMDAWITKHAMLKYRRASLTNQETRTEWERLKDIGGTSEAVLSSALQHALEAGEITNPEIEELRATLRKVALTRINDVRNQWALLTFQGRETFASIWAKGCVSDYFEEKYFNENLKGKPGEGLVRDNLPKQAQISDIGQLNPRLFDTLDHLIHDAIEYIKWTLNWPKFVQVVRSIEQGTVKFDITWPSQGSGSH